MRAELRPGTAADSIGWSLKFMKLWFSLKHLNTLDETSNKWPEKDWGYWEGIGEGLGATCVRTSLKATLVCSLQCFLSKWRKMELRHPDTECPHTAHTQRESWSRSTRSSIASRVNTSPGAPSVLVPSVPWAAAFPSAGCPLDSYNCMHIVHSL